MQKKVGRFKLFCNLILLAFWLPFPALFAYLVVNGSQALQQFSKEGAQVAAPGLPFVIAFLAVWLAVMGWCVRQAHARAWTLKKAWLTAYGFSFAVGALLIRQYLPLTHPM